MVKGRFELNITTEITFEYLEVFQQRFKAAKAATFYQFPHESDHVREIDIYFKWGLITEDADDNKFVDCYIAANADYLVTNDRHFRPLKNIDFPHVTCVTIDEFVEILNKRGLN